MIILITFFVIALCFDSYLVANKQFIAVWNRAVFLGAKWVKGFLPAGEMSVLVR